VNACKFLASAFPTLKQTFTSEDRDNLQHLHSALGFCYIHVQEFHLKRPSTAQMKWKDYFKNMYPHTWNFLDGIVTWQFLFNMMFRNIV